MYFEKLFPNKEIEWKCVYLMPRRVTTDTNLRIFQYKILNNVSYLNEKLFQFKIVSSPLCSFCNSEYETPIHLFYSRNQTKSLWSKLQELLNSERLLPQNAPQIAFFCFPDNEEHFEIINHLPLIFKYYLFKVRDSRQVSLEGSKKNVIKIYNIEKQICFNDSKKEIVVLICKYYWNITFLPRSSINRLLSFTDVYIYFWFSVKTVLLILCLTKCNTKFVLFCFILLFFSARYLLKEKKHFEPWNIKDGGGRRGGGQIDPLSPE